MNFNQKLNDFCEVILAQHNFVSSHYPEDGHMSGRNVSMIIM
jgi:hypothetical protein